MDTCRARREWTIDNGQLAIDNGHLSRKARIDNGILSCKARIVNGYLAGRWQEYFEDLLIYFELSLKQLVEN